MAFDVTKAHDNTAYYEAIEALEDKFELEREKVNRFIIDKIATKLGDIHNIPELQVHAASQRQRLVDTMSNIKALVRKKTKQILHNRKKLFYLYKTKHNISMGDVEINRHMDADLEHHTQYRIALENHIDFCKRSIETIDKTGFMVKYLIEQNKYLGGGY